VVVVEALLVVVRVVEEDVVAVVDGLVVEVDVDPKVWGCVFHISKSSAKILYGENVSYIVL
jgi:hypothetical protein